MANAGEYEFVFFKNDSGLSVIIPMRNFQMYIWKDADPEKYYNSCMIEFDTPTEKVYEMQTQRQCYE